MHGDGQCSLARDGRSTARRPRELPPCHARVHAEAERQHAHFAQSTSAIGAPQTQVHDAAMQQVPGGATRPTVLELTTHEERVRAHEAPTRRRLAATETTERAFGANIPSRVPSRAPTLARAKRACPCDEPSRHASSASPSRASHYTTQPSTSVAASRSHRALQMRPKCASREHGLDAAMQQAHDEAASVWRPCAANAPKQVRKRCRSTCAAPAADDAYAATSAARHRSTWRSHQIGRPSTPAAAAPESGARVCTLHTRR